MLTMYTHVPSPDQMRFIIIYKHITAPFCMFLQPSPSSNILQIRQLISLVLYAKLLHILSFQYVLCCSFKTFFQSQFWSIQPIAAEMIISQGAITHNRISFIFSYWKLLWVVSLDHFKWINPWFIIKYKLYLICKIPQIGM